MRVMLTGGTGFIGSRVARLLAGRGHEVVALVRSPERAAPLRALGASLVPGDVTHPETLEGAVRGAGAVVHLAAWYALGVDDRDGMRRSNVEGTENVLRAAAGASVARTVYCSSVAALGGRPPGEIGDEHSTHHGRFGSVYEESKFLALERVRALAAEGIRPVTVLPGGVYGPGDPGVIGALLRLYARRLLVAFPFQDVGATWVYVDDAAEGIVLALEGGEAGEEYVLAGDNCTIGDMLRRAAPHTGIRPPFVEIPAGVMRALVPASPLAGLLLRQPRGVLRDAVATLRGSWMFSSAKAEKALGYAFRPVEEGIPLTVGRRGSVPQQPRMSAPS